MHKIVAFLVECAIVITTLVCTAFIIHVIVTGKAFGHSWYPADCCHEQDCAEVLSSTSSWIGAPGNALVPPEWVVTTKFGSGVVPADIKRRPSPDGRAHACIVAGKVICIFLPTEG